MREFFEFGGLRRLTFNGGTMIENEMEIQLSAYADGELPAAERQALETRLVNDPVLTRQLERIRALQTAARAETAPQVFENEARAWPMVAARAFSFPGEVAAKLNAAAKTEECPVLSGEKARKVWKGIVGRALHSFPQDLFHNAPKVSDQNWSDAWKKISTRARIVKAEDLGAQASSLPARAGSPRTQEQARSLRSQRNVFSIWGWTAGIATAAAAILVFVLYAPPKPPDIEAQGTSMAMAIPESQDDRYGVMVKYVPGNDDPVVVMYEKTK